MSFFLYPPAKILWVMLIISLLTLMIVYASQYIGGLAPCQLCLWERIPYITACILSFGGLFLQKRGQKVIFFMLAFAFFASFGLGIFHVGVEWKLWKGLEGCAGSIDSGLTKEQLLETLMTTPTALCDTPAWTFLGVSMAGYNALLSLFLFRLSLKTIYRLCQKSPSLMH